MNQTYEDAMAEAFPAVNAGIQPFGSRVLVQIRTPKRKSSGGIKILGDGKLTKKLTVVADAFSASARQQIEALGGACEAPPVVPKVPRARTLPAPKAA